MMFCRAEVLQQQQLSERRDLPWILSDTIIRLSVYCWVHRKALWDGWVWLTAQCAYVLMTLLKKQ